MNIISLADNKTTGKKAFSFRICPNDILHKIKDRFVIINGKKTEFNLISEECFND